MDIKIEGKKRQPSPKERGAPGGKVSSLSQVTQFGFFIQTCLVLGHYYVMFHRCPLLYYSVPVNRVQPELGSLAELDQKDSTTSNCIPSFLHCTVLPQAILNDADCRVINNNKQLVVKITKFKKLMDLLSCLRILSLNPSQKAATVTNHSNQNTSQPTAKSFMSPPEPGVLYPSVPDREIELSLQQRFMVSFQSGAMKSVNTVVL